MIQTVIIACLTCILLITSILFFPKIRFKKIEISTYWIICLIGAILMILFQSISVQEIITDLTIDTSINPLKILVLFFSMTLLSIYLDEVGFFKYLASKASRIAKNNQKVLFFILYFLVSVLTIFTSNDIVILTFTPFICYFCKNSKINPIPYLVSEFACANTWSMMLIIGNPTNIYLATANDITFIEYLKVMLVPTIASGLVELLIIYLLFRKSLRTPLNIEFEKVELKDKVNLIIGLVHLGICLILLVISSYINLEMWIISFVCAISLLICILISNLIRKKDLHNINNTFKRLPWELIPFIISMFIIVGSINNQGVSDILRNTLGEKDIVIRYGISSFIECNMINNIPMSVLYSTLPHMSSQLLNLKAIYATIIGSNIGAFVTPIGALAGIMFTSLLLKYNVKYGFKNFIKYGIIISIPTILVALGCLELII